MTTIDRYLLRQFLQTFVICYVSLTGLYIIFDAFTNLEEFIRCADRYGGLLQLMASYYGYQSIVFFDKTSGLLALIAAMVTVALLQRHNEMTALLAAGVSRIRMAAPVIFAAITIALLAAGNRELVIPRLMDELRRTPQDLVGDVAREMRSYNDNETDVWLRGRSTLADQQRIIEPNFQLPPALQHVVKQIKAEQALYKPPQAGRPGGYLMIGVREPKGLDARPTIELGGRPLVITHCDAPNWLAADQCFLVSNVTFDQLAGGKTFVQFASTGQLIAALHNPSLDFSPSLRVAIHCRLVQPLIDITLLLLGLPLVVTRHTRNVFFAIGMCIAIISVFSLTVIGMQAAGGICLLQPAQAAWFPLIVFVPAAVGFAQQMWE